MANLLEVIGRKAIAEQVARASRNKAQANLSKWRRQWDDGFEPGCAEPRDDEEHEALMGAKREAQATYYRARSATRRAVALFSDPSKA